MTPDELRELELLPEHKPQPSPLDARLFVLATSVFAIVAWGFVLFLCAGMGVGFVAVGAGLFSESEGALSYVGAALLVATGLLFIAGCVKLLSMPVRMLFDLVSSRTSARRADRRHSRRERARDDGRARVLRVEALRAAGTRAVEDESETWLFDVGDDRTLCLTGRYLDGVITDEPELAEVWPPATFEIVRTLEHGLFVGITLLAPVLEEIVEIEPGRYDLARLPKKNERILSEPLEAVLDRARLRPSVVE